MSLTLDLLRHGDTGTAPGFRGSLDDPLSAIGWAQLRAAVNNHAPWTRIISSPLQRCAAFAAELAEQRQLPLSLERNLRELEFGAWEGLTPAALMETHSIELGHFWSDPYSFTPPQGEPLSAFEARVLGALQRLAAQHAGEHLLLVTHAGVIRLLLARARQLQRHCLLQVEVKHAALFRLHVSLQEVLHLEECPCTPS
ncbi:histidine phosphatase family protein [Azomonas macrocytogenes]|uniref:Alpha-ribazole phosphatase n=1 Tax=Azomonas macrocytogenes TaxID=69962 RepID=A0A839T4A7_AZOMA|nr:histidine phosphatase family protein [Azomonas macrocytogenes]MBB3104262.1 alpha-ribazole phosphatase [Azomonas macrocytogenes]